MMPEAAALPSPLLRQHISRPPLVSHLLRWRIPRPAVACLHSPGSHFKLAVSWASLLGKNHSRCGDFTGYGTRGCKMWQIGKSGGACSLNACSYSPVHAGVVRSGATVSSSISLEGILDNGAMEVLNAEVKGVNAEAPGDNAQVAGENLEGGGDKVEVEAGNADAEGGNVKMEGDSAQLEVLNAAHAGGLGPDEEAEHEQEVDLLKLPIDQLMAMAERVRDAREDADVVTFSPKVFLPVTRLCRDRCAYCVFAVEPGKGERFRAYMTEEEVLRVAAQGAARGCTEALFTLGDKPELRYPEAKAALARLGFSTTVEYVAHLAQRVLEATGLLPHVNAGVMSLSELQQCRKVSASQGLMLESTAPELLLPGGPHFQCPDKEPAVRLATIQAAGRARVPFTTGLLVGIGESRGQRVRDLLTLRSILRGSFQGPGGAGHLDEASVDAPCTMQRTEDCLQQETRHIQEVIIQPFREKSVMGRGAAMSEGADSFSELLWTVAAARVILGPEANIQSPPNLSAGGHEQRMLMRAGINDWGGISPLTPDFVNPEAPWPHVEDLARTCSEEGKLLVPRLPVYPRFIRDIVARETWLDPVVARHVARLSDSQGYSRGQDWAPGLAVAPPALWSWNARTQRQAAQGDQDRECQAGCGGGEGQTGGKRGTVEGARKVEMGGDGLLVLHSRERCREAGEGIGHDHVVGAPAASSRGVLGMGSIEAVLEKLEQGKAPSEGDIVALFSARGDALRLVCSAAHDLRAKVNGGTVTYVVNRNINYTNMCTYGCKFCAFSKGKASEELRGAPYLMGTEEIERRVVEAWERGATEVCMQGGIHPEFTGDSYLRILRAVKGAVPDIHVHAFSPLEVWHGAQSLNVSLRDFLKMLRDEGLGSLPGTAAEVLDDEVRRVLCPDKLSTQQWLQVVETAHSVGLPSTSTIMFGHVDSPSHWARHLLLLRGLQERTGGITEFVPLPFVHMQAPLYASRLGGGARRGPTFHECVLMHAVARLVLHPLIRSIQASWVKMGPGGARELLQVGCNDMGGTLMNESITRAAGATHGQELTPAEMDAVISSLGRVPKQRTTLYGVPPPAQVERSYSVAPLLA